MSPSELSLLELTVLFKWLCENYGTSPVQDSGPTSDRERLYHTMLHEVERNILSYGYTVSP